MDTVDRIKQQIADHPILLYMKGSPDFPSCGFSARAVQILRALGYPFESINILEHPDIRSRLPEFSQWPTFPQLWVSGELIGGCDIMQEMFQSHELQPLLAAAASSNLSHLSQEP
jgi:monothiol glutaredoxin